MKIKAFILTFFLFYCLTTLSANEFDEFDDLESEFTITNEVYDPLIKYNRFMTSFNLFLYDYIEYPIAVRYNGLVPKPIKTGINNFFYNLATPVRVVGYLIGLEPKKALNEIGYFMINTTWGIGGFIDITKEHKLLNKAKKDVDAGIGLAHIGVGPGPHIVLPILGPSNLRDTLTMPITMLSNPISYVKPLKANIGINTIKYTNKYSEDIKEINMLYKSSLDPYILIRDYYEQHRKELSK